MMKNLYDKKNYTGLELAVIGLDCKFPQAHNAEEFWENLKHGTEGITFFSEQELIESGIEPALCKDPNYIKAKGILEDIDKFDPLFFDYTPREIATLDPQVRIFHECVSNALENAGYNPETYTGQIGLFAGSTLSLNWLLRQLIANENPTFNMSFREYLCTSISYKLKLTGPSVTVLTACSTSLVAVHMACQALLNGECSIAVAGGVNISLPLKKGYYYTDELIYSPDGHCRAFDAASRGTLISDGAGAVVLKTLQDAINDRDNIYAVIKGSAINNDGNRKVGFSAPSINGQKEVIETALHMAAVEPESITMLEAHGTGTKVGDSIEIEALKRAYRTNRKGYCAIGSVKSNIGHLNEAAGIAGLIKTVLAIKHRQIPQTINFMNPNQKIEFENSPFYVNDRLKDWEAGEFPLRAGVSSFGIGGTNAHVILEEPPAIEKHEVLNTPKLFVVSAKTETALLKQCMQLKDYLLNHPEISLDDAAYTLQVGRINHQFRTYFVINRVQEIIDALNSGTVKAKRAEKGESSVLIVLPELTGNMDIIKVAVSFYKSNTLFQSEIDHCINRLKHIWKIDLNSVLTGNKDLYDQKAIHFLIEYALAKVLLKLSSRHLGFLGIGTGNYAAASLSGAVALENSFAAFINKNISYITENQVQQPGIPLYSPITGGRVSVEDIKDAGFWNDVLENPLAFSDGIQNLLSVPKTIVSYLGSGDCDQGLLEKINSITGNVADLLHDAESTDPYGCILKHIGELWSSGLAIDWEALYQDHNFGRVPLPTYPFERNRYFLDEDPMKIGLALLKQNKTEARQKDISGWFYQPSWKRLASRNAAHKAEPQPPMAVFMDTDIGGLLREYYDKSGQKPKLIAWGDNISLRSVADYRIESCSRENYTHVLEEFRKDTASYPDTILFFNLRHNKFNEDEHLQWRNYLKETFFGLLHLVQAIGDLNLKKPVRLIIVASNVVDILGDEEIDPVKACLLGLPRSISMEYPDIECKLIDITGQEHLLASGLLDRLAEEFDDEANHEDVAAYRGKYKWVPAYEPMQTEHIKSPNPALKENGVYLITGGTGGIGLELADYIAENCRAKVILIGSSFFPPKSQWDNWLRTHADNDKISVRIKRICEIERKGSQVFVYQTDVSNFAELKETINQVQGEFGNIIGVVHAAGVPGNGLIQNKDQEDADKVLMPKISGCVYLHQLLKGNNLDFFVLCSSISTIFPIIGQSDYNAANAFLDAYALHARNSGSGNITSIKWDVWKDVGMASKYGMAVHAKQEVRHPLADYYVNKNGKHIYHLRLDFGRHWVLQDHRTENYGVMSGTALLEMVRQAVENSIAEKPFTLQDVHFISPITVEEAKGKDVCLIIERNDGGYHFNIYSRAGNEENLWLPHVTGRIGQNAKESGKMDILLLKELCSKQDVVFTESDNRKHAGHLIFGKRWLNIKQVMVGDNQGLAVIELPDEYKGDLEDYQLHPGLLDSATSFLLGFINKTGSYIPLSYETLEIYGKLPQKVYSYCRLPYDTVSRDDVVNFDIQVMDEHGNILVNIKNYTMLAITDSIIRQIEKGEKHASPLILDEMADVNHFYGEDVEKEGILSTEGKEIFGRILTQDVSTVIISSTCIDNRLKKSKPQNIDRGFDKHQAGSLITRSKRPELVVEYKFPVTDTEKKLVEIYEDLICISPIGIEDDIFELGIDSLKAIHLTSRIKKAFNINLKLADVFNHKTIKSLAEFVDKENSKEFAEILPVEKKSHYQTSFSQKRLFFLHGLLGDSTAYNESTAFLLEGPVSPEKIEETFIKIIERHESLRTSFKAIDGEIVQIIHPNTDFKLIYLESSNEMAEEEIKRAIRPFDLEHAPLLRVSLIKLENQKYILVLDIHHIIADGTSINLILNDFVKLYMGHSLPPLKIQYKDFSEWQNNYMASKQYKAQEAFWLNMLDGPLPVLNLPYDYPRPLNLDFNGELLQLKIDAQLTGAIKDFSRDNDVTWFMTLLAAYYVLLGRLSGEEDILIGIPQAGRHHNDINDIVGMFVNTLVLRNKPQLDKSFMTFLGEVKQNLIQALENQDFQIEMIVDKLDFKRDPSRTFLYDTIFNYQSMKNRADLKEFHLGEIRLTPYPQAAKTTKTDINIHLYEINNCICIDWFYRTDLFKKETIQYFIGEYQKLLHQIIRNPDRTLRQFQILLPETVSGRRDSTLPLPEIQPMNYKSGVENIITRFEKQVCLYPEKPAVKDGFSTLTYRRLNEKANLIAWKIIEQASFINGSETVSLLFGNQIDMIAALIGTLKSGVPFVPLDRSFPAERIGYIIKDAQSKLLITNSENLQLAHDIVEVAKIDLAVINIDEITCKNSVENPGTFIDKEKAALILYTSGSTGKPKGAIQTHKNLYFYISQFTHKLCINCEDRIPLLTPYCHAIGMLDILASLLNGCTLHLYDFKLDGNMLRFANWLNNERITIFHAVPTIFRFFMKNLNESISLPYLRMVILGGEVVTKTDFDFYRENCPENCLFVNFLGCSELMVISFFIADKRTDIRNTTVPTGYVVEDIKLKILDEHNREVGIYEVGELFYCSEYVSPGYLNNSDITQKTFLKNTMLGDGTVYKSGDYGRLLPDGCLEYHGRKDSQVKIRGFRVDLNEIETVIDSLEFVKKSVVKFVKDENSEYIIAVYYVLKEPATEKDIIGILKGKLPSYLIPQRWMELKSFPMTETNKIDRKALPELNFDRTPPTEYISPQNETEKALLDIWSEVLNVDSIGIDDGFFDLGGHSLKLMQVQNNLEKKLGIRVDMTDLFKYPTIRSLASFIKGRQTSSYLDESKQRGEMRKSLIKRRRN